MSYTREWAGGDRVDSNYRTLGMDRQISRRDFMNGVAMAAGALVVPKWLWRSSRSMRRSRSRTTTRRALTGMRGSHAGSFEVAPAARPRAMDVVQRDSDTGETYDLVVVGGGLSGLRRPTTSSRRRPRARRVLVLDNHDDFGGHAKRNEFVTTASCWS